MTITPFGYGAFTVLGLSLLLAFFVNRRFNNESEQKGGCLGALFLGTIVVSISTLFATSILILTTSSYAFVVYPKFEATVVDIESEWVEQDYTDSDGRARTRTVEMHTAILKFTDAEGELIIQPNNIRSGKSPILGDTLTIAYQDGDLHELSPRAILLLFGLSLMMILLGLLVATFTLYAMHKKTERVRSYGFGFLFFVVIPLAMFGMMAGMIYGVWDHHANDGDMPIWAQVVAVFFALVLFMSLLGYFKMILRDDEEAV